MRINQNIAAFNAYRNLNQTQGNLGKSLEKLSSGFRINRAADDAAGLVNSENLRSQIGGLNVATRNAQDAISMVQTAEGAQTEVHSLLQRMRDLAVQSGNLGTNDEAALQAAQDEITELTAELDRIGEQTQFGNQTILDGTFSGSADEAISTALSGAAYATGVDDGTTGSAVVDADAFWGEVDTALAPDYADYSGKVELTFTATGGETGAISVAVSRDASSDEIARALNTELESIKEADAYDGWADDLQVSHNFQDGEVTLSDSKATPDVDLAVSVDAVGSGAVFQVGANGGQTVDVAINEVSAAALGVENVDVTDSSSIDQAISDIDDAIGSVSSNRAELGAFQNRMESTIRNISVATENLSAAESRIRDTDMALEMVEFTRNQILSQAGTAMLAQANMVPQSVLSLLQ